MATMVVSQYTLYTVTSPKRSSEAESSTLHIPSPRARYQMLEHLMKLKLISLKKKMKKYYENNFRNKVVMCD
jgi:hypothetical protein